MTTYLDVAQLPTSTTMLKGPSEELISERNMGRLVMNARPAIESLQSNGLIRVTPSFGFAMAVPWLVGCNPDDQIWNDYHQLVWFVAGWGPDRDRYIANAVRKLRPSPDLSRREIGGSVISEYFH